MDFNYQSRNKSPFGGIVSLVILGFVLVGLYYLFSSFHYYLSRVAPILLIAALVIRHKVVVDFFNKIVFLVKKMPPVGILSLVAIYFMYPFVAFYLFTKSLRKPIPIGQRTQQNPFSMFFEPPPSQNKANQVETEFTEFEDITETKKESKSDKQDDDYDRFFDL